MSSRIAAAWPNALRACLLSVLAVAAVPHQAQAGHRTALTIPPVTTVSSITTTCPIAPFGVGNWPGSCWRPYSTTSPFNKPIPGTARVAANSAGMVSRLMGFGTPSNLVAGTAGTPDDWGHPTYYSRSIDPEFTLNCTEPWGTCAVEGMRIRIPNAAKAAGGGDAHMTVVDQASGWEYDMWGVQSKPAGGGRLDFRWGGRTRIDGDGRNSDATASRFGNLAGVIRAAEMRAGRINHALFMVINCDSSGFVYPATKGGRPCTDKTNAIPMGSRFRLNMTAAEIDAMSVPAWKKTILRAMREYGMYVGDTGGGAWGMQFESGTGYTSLGAEDPMVTFARDNRVPMWEGKWIFNLRDGVDWARKLGVVDVCTTQGTC